MAKALKLPVIDLTSPDSLATANLIRRACIEDGFFYLVNHGVGEELVKKVFDESKKFFLLPLEDKMNLARKEHRGYSPLYAEILDPSSGSKGDGKESFYIGHLEDDTTKSKLNQWPSAECLPTWRSTMESYYRRVLFAGRRLLSLVSIALNLNEDFFEKAGGLERPTAFLRLLRYPGNLGSSDEELNGAGAHSDYGMITLLITNGVQGLQVCRDKDHQPQVWEDVPNIDGAFIVNIGDMMERWTNNFFRSTLHRVIPVGQERYSVAFFLDPDDDCLVECLESCCSKSCPPRYPPVRSGDYFKERFRLTYGS